MAGRARKLKPETPPAAENCAGERNFRAAPPPNHVHSVWRDFDHDFGADLLGEHYKAAHPAP